MKHLKDMECYVEVSGKYQLYKDGPIMGRGILVSNMTKLEYKKTTLNVVFCVTVFSFLNY